MLIREYIIKDNEKLIAALYRFQGYLAELDPLKRVQCQSGFGEVYVDDLLKKISKNNGKILIVEEDGGVIGFASGYIEEISEQERLGYIPVISGYIPDIYLDPEYRGTGIGAQLMEKMEQYFKEKGCNLVSFKVLKSNEVAHEFYKKLGYEDREYIMEKMI